LIALHTEPSACVSDPELTTFVEAWPVLPDMIKAEALALVDWTI